MKIYLTVFLILLTNSVFSQWTTIGNACISSNVSASAGDVKLAFNVNTAYIAFRDGFYSQRATVKKYNGTNWVNVGSAGFSPGAAYYISLILNGNTPYLAYQDVANGNKATVMMFDGTNWVNVGNPGFSAGVANYTSIILNSNTLYVAYQDVANGSKATVMMFDGSNWINVGNAGFSAGTADAIALSHNNGNLYVSYTDGANFNKATVMMFDGNNWVNVGNPGFSTGIAYTTSIALNGNTPYVAYTDGANSNKATVMMFDGTNWVNVGNAGFSLGAIDKPQIAINNGSPFVAYRDLFNCGFSGGRGTAMKYDGTNWINVGNSCFTHTSTNVQSFINSFSFNNNEPYVAFTDAACGAFTKATVMKFSCNSVNSIIQVACKSYTLNNQTYTQSGIYTQLLTNTQGCDSTLTINLTINIVDTSVTQNGNVFIANANNATYQWLNCNSGFAIISGATNQSFTPTANGNYAVVVTQNSCSDTSGCYNFNTTGINTYFLQNDVIIYPNPFITQTVLQSNVPLINATLTLCNHFGQKVKEIKNISGQTIVLTRDNLESGLYFLQLTEENKTTTVNKLEITD